MNYYGCIIIDLIVKLIDSSISEKELDELRAVIENNPYSKRLFCEYMDVWQSSVKYNSEKRYDEKIAWSKLKNKLRLIDKNVASNRKVFLLSSELLRRVAVIIILVLLVGTAGFIVHHINKESLSKSSMTEYVVPYGSRSKVILPDGSSIWLNAGSRLSYNRYFSLKNRDVFLQGEGYFDVTRDKLPFNVVVNGATIKVLGTAFNVKAYPDEKVIETTVTRGMVQVFDNQTNKEQSSKIILYANQKVSIIKRNTDEEYASHNPIGEVSQGRDDKPNVLKIKEPERYFKVDHNIEPSVYTSWKDPRWIIEKEELHSLAVKLERRYNVEIMFKDESLKHYVFSGILKDETLEQVLEAIKLTAPINYQIIQKQVVLSKNKLFKSTF